jgi:hypothetical protein
MEHLSSVRPAWTKVMRWIARIISLLFILATLFFFMAEEVFRDHPRTVPLPIGPLVMGALLLVGLGLAWKWELVGALIALVGFIGVSIVNPDALTKAAWYIFAVPPILFLLCWWWSKSPRPAESNMSQAG